MPDDGMNQLIIDNIRPHSGDRAVAIGPARSLLALHFLLSSSCAGAQRSL